MEKHNRLAEAASAYLQAARDQPVAWHEWGEAAFAQAQREGKPVLLDVGATWCHWCHVMDRDSYSSPEIAALINELFVAVKVDRDERPALDARYQAAVSAISGQAGWPLTVFLTPEGKPYFGGTYFAAEERYGQPSFERVLRSMADAFRHQRAEVQESADSVMTAIEQSETLSGHGQDPGPALLDKMLESITSQFDPRNGGFGSQPKFPYAPALALLLDVANGPGAMADRAREVVALTLRKMADGGIYDQLAGGFHRYSVDERWSVPRFEKMAFENAELLGVYAQAARVFAEPRFAEVATGIVRWMDEWMSDREAGGFHASQSADAAPEDHGAYFTWTLDEAAAVLLPAEFEVAAAYYDLRAVGDMHHDPAKNVLRVVADVPALASRFGRSDEQTQSLLESAQRKLSAARRTRPTPFIDQTLYAGWNGLCVSAYLAAGALLGLPAATAFALKSLDRVLKDSWTPGGRLWRVVAYDERQQVTGERIPGVLEDYVYVANAALDAWEVTHDPRYAAAAEQLAEVLLTRFYDEAEGGFFDMEKGGSALGALAARRKPLQDAPAPAGNPAAARLLLHLHRLTKKDVYHQRAEATLGAFAEVAEHLGLYGASYGQVLQDLLYGAREKA